MPCDGAKVTTERLSGLELTQGQDVGRSFILTSKCTRLQMVTKKDVFFHMNLCLTMPMSWLTK